MVRFPNPGELAGPWNKAAAVKVEIEDSLEEEHGPLGKRSKPSPVPGQQFGEGAGAVATQTVHYNLLDEPSPLGLRLKKSPSLVELIQMRLRGPNSSTASCITNTGSFNSGKKDLKSTAVSAGTEKMKASNFPASLLRIGTWECVSRYEGDLVAKCYYAKHKLVWEVLEGGLKSKIEIQWSDITALKPTFPENGPGTLDIVLARQPLFFRETNPQPRKHTLWQATSDFTGGQASIQRRHFLQCQQGLLNKHFEKLIQCDPRLNALSRQPDIILESPYFEPRCSAYEDQDEHKCVDFDDLKDDCRTTLQGLHEPVSPCTAPSTSNASGAPNLMTRETRSPNSVMDARAVEENVGNATEGPKGQSCWDQLKNPVLRSSMSKQDLVSHLEHCISEQVTSGTLPSKAALEALAEELLSDSPAFNDDRVMARVNSFYSLLQDFNTAQNPQANTDRWGLDRKHRAVPEPAAEKSSFEFPVLEGEPNETSTCKQPPSISRKESFGDLLLNLPRIASLPQFMFNIYEDAENQAR